jgi:hypothetical protein
MPSRHLRRDGPWVLALGALLLAPMALSIAAEKESAGTNSPYQSWPHSGSLYILTTPQGADLPAAALVEGFPLLVRLHHDFFNFSQAKAHGEDLRFSSSTGAPLAYQVEEWDAANGTAALWVRIPKITGDARQEIKLHWGAANAISESSGASVFNESNGYLSVWHMNDPVQDEAGMLHSKDEGTTATAGIIGAARHFSGQQGVSCGDQINGYPTGSRPFSSEAWFRSDHPNGSLLSWGNEEAQGKVVMQYRSPPHINMDCYFSDANVEGGGRLAKSEWTQVMHTYQKGDSRLYVNGVLNAVSANRSAPLNLKSPARLWIGGWQDRYDFIGDIDEVRISKVARSAEWVKLQFENQKPMQTLVGPLVPAGSEFSVSPAKSTVPEGKTVTFSAQAGGAQKIYWLLQRDGRETIVAVDRLQFTFAPGRVTGDSSATLQFKAIGANGVRTRDIPITIHEDIPDPVFALKAPATWDGRTRIEVVPRIANLSEMQAKGAGDLNYTWSVSNVAVISEAVPGKLILRRAQKGGQMTVTATVQNGGRPAIQSASIAVTEPERDAWVARTPAEDEKPEDNQFFARDDQGEGTLHCNGTLAQAAESVFLRIYADERLYRAESRELAADKSYAFTVKLKPGLVRYRVEFGLKTSGHETVLHAATNLVCGDAYVIQGQSNAVATDWGREKPTFQSDWIRTFGSMSDDPNGLRLWGNAVHRGDDSEKLQVGYWGMELARRLVENHRVPICIINGAVGGTRIDQHQRNPENPTDMSTIYGRLLWRVKQAKLTHGIRGILWHQGENDQGADGPTGGYGWETYRQYFIDLAAAWKQDFPNLQHYYLFQIWPKACAMGVKGSDNLLREVQRTLPYHFSNLSVMSTLGIDPPGDCHYPAAGYGEIARLICPLLERDHYGTSFTQAITPPDLRQAYYASDKKDEVVMEFDQPVKWDNGLASQFYLDGEQGKVASGTGSGPVVTLKLASASAAQKLTYLDSKSWSPTNLLRGENGIAALTFCEVPILSIKPAR